MALNFIVLFIMATSHHYVDAHGIDDRVVSLSGQNHDQAVSLQGQMEGRMLDDNYFAATSARGMCMAYCNCYDPPQPQPFPVIPTQKQAPPPVFPTQPAPPGPGPTPSGNGRDLFVYINEQSFSVQQGQSIIRNGGNHVIFTFYCTTGGGSTPTAYDAVLAMQGKVQQLKSFADDNGAKLFMSIGGATDTSWLYKPYTVYTNSACKYAVQQGYHGVDWDLENIPSASSKSPYSSWIINAARACSDMGLLQMGAPQSPYFGAGGFGDIGGDQARSGLFYKLLVQFYNQGEWGNPHNYNELYIAHNSGMALKEMQRSSPSFGDNFVVGIPYQEGDGDSDYFAKNIMPLVCQAEQDGVTSSGVMFWKYHEGEETGYNKLTKKC